MHAVVVDKISRSFGVNKVLDNLSFSIKEGSIHGFLGPNGAGKSTTMKILSGLLAPHSGEVKIFGESLTEHQKKVKKQIGILPDELPLYYDMVVSDFLHFVARLNGVDLLLIEQYVDECLKKTGLEENRGRIIGNLSRGYKQRVALAQAMVFKPKILILDEPTVGLDPNSVKEIRELILSLKKDHTIFLSSHILSEVSLMCNDLTIINRGKIMATGTVEEIHQQFKTKNILVCRVHSISHLEKIQNLEYVNKLETKQLSEHEYELRVDINSTNDMRAELSEAIIKNKMGLLTFNEEKLDLEKLFLEVIK
ncbi:MAG: ABC transporter ATP-binding protein [Bacteriovoracaceae bacterium]|nr:ABC transporter ATP-binding protein [Bacteriovoracaceae bacterium]